MFITGPDVVKTVTGEEVTQQELGGAITHASKSGVCQFMAADDKSCLDDVRYLLQLPAREQPRGAAGVRDRPTIRERRCPELIDLIPAVVEQPYDMHKVIEAIVDDGEFFEYAARWAPNIVCAFARLDGHPVGIVGNQPMHLAGVLDIESSEKAARFVRTCDAFNIPLLTFVDVPGFLPGCRPGVRRHHPPRRQAAVRLLRVDRSAHPDHHAQGVRRRLRRHELEVDRRRPRVRVAVGRARRHGPAGRGRDRVPPRVADGRRPRRPQGRAGRGVHRALRQPVRCGRAGLRRRRDRPRRDADEDHRRVRAAAIEARGAAEAQARQLPL